MCGIVGIIKSQGEERIDPAIVRRMNQTLIHRGPDDEGYYFDRGVGLAMRRLKIIDCEGGHQPIANETEDVWTVFNGEIYNYQSLREDLVRKGHRLRSRSDTEVLVHLYEEEGEKFVHKLRGMFALALWDKAVRKLLLYRDRMGIKPLHYWARNGTLVFASEIKALLEWPEVGRDLSLAALNDYLSFLYIPTPRTIYQEVHKLPAGHFLRLQDGKIDIECYWDLSFQPKLQIKEEEWIEGLRHGLEESVRLHRISDVPLGAFLSGGMDSSTIVAWMSQQSSEAVKTFSIGFPNDRYNELPYARRVARHFGTDHHEKMVQVDAFKLLPQIVAAFDEPFADSSAIPTYFVSQFARKSVTVALSGDGGDELFGGYLWTQKELWLEKYRSLPTAIRRGFEKVFLRGGYRPYSEVGLWAALQRFFFDAGRNPYESYGRRAMSFQPWMKSEMFEPWVLRALKNDESLDFIRSLFEGDSSRAVLDQFLYADSKVYLPDDLLTKVDRMSMFHSLEVRVPLLDHHLIEIACQIPSTLKFKGRNTKYILRKAMEGFLPTAILKQRKQGFSIPIHHWFRFDLHPFARRLLLGDVSLSRRYFRRDYVRWLLDQHAQGKQRFGSQVYALVVFELWCRLVQGEPAAAVLEDVNVGHSVP